MQYLLTDDWENLEELVIYGFGKVAHDNIEFIKRNFNILYILFLLGLLQLYVPIYLTSSISV